MVAAVLAHPGPSGVEFVPSGVAFDDIWTYERAPGRRGRVPVADRQRPGRTGSGGRGVRRVAGRAGTADGGPGGGRWLRISPGSRAGTVPCMEAPLARDRHVPTGDGSVRRRPGRVAVQPIRGRAGTNATS